MYFTMGHHLLKLPTFTFFKGVEGAIYYVLFQLVLTLAVIVLNIKFFIKGTRAVINKAPNMDTLVALGSLASFIWSVYLVFRMAFDASGAHGYLHELYFESAAMIVGFITLGKLLEAIAKGKTTSAIEALIELTPKLAHVVRNGEEIVIPASKHPTFSAGKAFKDAVN
jgi:Cu2+-exporting ATPase